MSLNQTQNRSRPMLRHLLSSTAIHTPIPRRPDDRADDRIAVATAYLERRPIILHHPWSGEVIWVESEPKDWREFFEEHDAKMAAKRARMLH